MTLVRILADDLTGALDAAAPFAASRRPVHLGLRSPLDAAKQTISSESRELSVGAARQAVRAALDRLRPGADAGTLWFKKVDSVLRGWPVDETLELMHSLELRACVFAPAFPEMARRTIDGFHEVADPKRPGEWLPASIHDLRAAFEAAGAQVGMLGDAGAESGILIGNAVKPGDLRTLISHTARCGVLWAGSRGLAEALCFPRPPIAIPPVGTVILGTNHPVTRRQVKRLRESDAAKAVTVIDPVPTSANASETVQRIGEELTGMDHPGETALIVVGGNTLTAVLAAIDAQSLACRGEIAPGLPLSTIIGGRFSGATLISKSGGFGDADLLARVCVGGRR